MSLFQDIGQLKISDIPGLGRISLEELHALGRGELQLIPATRLPAKERFPFHKRIIVSQSMRSHSEMIRHIGARFSLSSWAFDYIHQDTYLAEEKGSDCIHVVPLKEFCEEQIPSQQVISRAYEWGYTPLSTEMLCELRLAILEEILIEPTIDTIFIPVKPSTPQLRAPMFFIRSATFAHSFGASYFEIEDDEWKNSAIAFLAPEG